MLTSILHLLRRLFALRRGNSDASSGLGTHLIFRLKAWPRLPEAGRTAEIYRMLSVMSSQPVNRQWLLSRCSSMAPGQLDALLLQLRDEGALEVIDPSGFAPSHSAA
jgi:hypothetical protein